MTVYESVAEIIVSGFCDSKVISLDFTHDHVFRKITLENCDFHQIFLATECNIILSMHII